MNGFCGAVNYEKKDVDFALLGKMSRFIGEGWGELYAAALPCCSVIYRDERESAQQPLCTSIRGQDYIAAAISDRSGEDSGYLAESVLCGYTDEGMSYLERLCGSLCSVVFNRAFGETVLISSGASARCIYYVMRDRTMYFASELKAILCAVEAYDGRVRIDSPALAQRLISSGECSPHKLFCGIERVGSGEGIIFSSFGISSFKICTDKKSNAAASQSSASFGGCERNNACAEAEKQLRRFGYPRFDVATESGKSNKLLYKGLVAGLERELGREGCVLYKLFDAQALRSFKILRSEKNIPARIRLAGMLYQTAKWFENENIYL